MRELTSVDFNADVGEANDKEGIAVERSLLSFVTSVHVACGGHAGDETSMGDTVEAALTHGVSVGAHPSYPDREGFGRRHMAMAPHLLTNVLIGQLGAFGAVCHQHGAGLRSVKPHGALYSEVGKGGQAFDALRAAMRVSCLPSTRLVLPAGSAAAHLCRQQGVPMLEEGFCDRAYADDGTLVDRDQLGAVLQDPEQAARQAVKLVAGGTIDTLCVHGDSPGAVALAEAVRRALEQAGVAVRAPAGAPT